MAPRNINADPTLSADEQRAARGRQMVVLDTAASGPALQSACVWIKCTPSTEGVAGAVELEAGDWKLLSLHGAIFAAEASHC